MRKVVKRDDERTEKLASNETYELIKDIVININKDRISSSIYRDSYVTKNGARSHVEDHLAISYKNKCAYCERLEKADIEHYRPKKSVAGENDHDGYYWLCYEWSNLIPSCITCNREGAKHTKFPIQGTRVYYPPDLIEGELNLEQFKADSEYLSIEKPYLLHPEVDDPSEYFSFKIAEDKKGIEIIGIDDIGRGLKTIDICKLN